MGKNIEFISVIEAERNCVENIDLGLCEADCENCALTIQFNMRQLDMALTEAIDALKFEEDHFNDYNNGYSKGYNDGYDNCYAKLSEKENYNTNERRRHTNWSTKN